MPIRPFQKTLRYGVVMENLRYVLLAEREQIHSEFDRLQMSWYSKQITKKEYCDKFTELEAWSKQNHLEYAHVIGRIRDLREQP
jgi:hypothetical protein